ncbi:MAG: ABC transporter ATP-binding protein [Ginsengibacter sp.]
MEVLSIESISKNYGKIQALKSVTFTVSTGTVFGILGPNGSGKTTLLGIVMDILQPTSGTFKLFSVNPVADHRKQIGTLLETPNFYHYLSGEENLRIAASIKERGTNDIHKVLTMVNLYERRSSKFSTYSLGMKQRLAIASCLLGDPEVMIFDEPTNGLDPEGIAEIRELIKKLHHEGKTIIMASHLLDEVEKVCTHVAILKKGNLLATGDVNEILVNEDIVEIGATDLGKLRSVIAMMEPKLNATENGQLLQLSYPVGKARLDDINDHCFKHGLILNHLSLKKKSLETKFFELTNN